MTLGERLTTLRQERGWKLRDQRAAIEQATGKRIALSYLSSLERSVQTGPSIIVLAHIAAGYGMSVQQLIHVVLFDVRSEHDMRADAADQRARATRAAFDAFYAEGTPYTELERAIFGQVVDAAIAEAGLVLAPAGGTVTDDVRAAVERGRWERVTENLNAWMDLGAIADITSASRKPEHQADYQRAVARLTDAAMALQPGDLDADHVPEGGLTATPFLIGAIERLLDGTETSVDRSALRRWMGQ